MQLSSFLIYTMACLVWAYKPGPGMLLHASKALSDGCKPAIIMALGTETGLSIAFLALWLGYYGQAQTSPIISGVIPLISGLYLTYVSVKNILAESINSVEKKNRKGLGSQYLYGILWAFMNPLNIAFLTGVIPKLFVSLDKMESFHFLILWFTLVLSVFSAHLTYIYFAEPLRHYFSNKKKLKSARVIGDSIFIILGLFVCISSIITLLESAHVI